MPLPHPPVEPPPSAWDLGGVRLADDDLVAVGGDLEPGTILQAYRSGLFPMGLGEHGAPPIGWWSPDPRGVLLPGDLHVSRSLRRALPRFEIRIDTAFDEVVGACADASRDGRWITPEVARAYGGLHALGWAHSVEAWQDGRLVGGLYGLAIGGLFAGESMFHRVTDASKVALVGLVDAFFGGRTAPASRYEDLLIDVQWQTAHLASLGVREVSRREYAARLRRALAVPAISLRSCTPGPS